MVDGDGDFLNGIDSPLYSAVINPACTATSLSSNRAKASHLCCDGPDIILTLESEPVNYAASGLHCIHSHVMLGLFWRYVALVVVLRRPALSASSSSSASVTALR